MYIWVEDMIYEKWRKEMEKRRKMENLTTDFNYIISGGRRGQTQVLSKRVTSSGHKSQPGMRYKFFTMKVGKHEDRLHSPTPSPSLFLFFLTLFFFFFLNANTHQWAHCCASAHHHTSLLEHGRSHLPGTCSSGKYALWSMKFTEKLCPS